MPETTIERRIGDIILDVTIEERHEDSLTITEHPVEKGATISDHAYANPKMVSIIAGKGATEGESVPKETYDALLELQESREPFSIITGKREYENMLAEGISVQTDPETEYVLMVRLDCREVIIVETETTQVPVSRQREAAKTQKTQNAGTKQAQETQSGQNNDNVTDSRKQSVIKGIIGG